MVEHADFDGIERLALVTGGEIVSTFGNPDLVKLGHCDVIEQAAPMHDIGKIGVPDSILLKRGQLTAHERSIMMQHARMGYEILRDSPSKYLQFGATIAWCHHEKYNGEGYPRGLAGDDIPIEARIVAIADVFDALLSERPYKQAWSIEHALDLIRSESGQHFDPECVEALLVNLDRIVASRELLRTVSKPTTG